jgi:hypothetical protein
LVLLKLSSYGYLNRVQSSRRLEREAGRNIEVMWLTRLAPDHKTIADFRRDNGGGIVRRPEPDGGQLGGLEDVCHDRAQRGDHSNKEC